MTYRNDLLALGFIHCPTFNVVLRFESLFCFHLQLSTSSGRSLWCSETWNTSFWGVQQIKCFPLPEDWIRAAFRNAVLLWNMTEKVENKKNPWVIRCTSLDNILILDCTAISAFGTAVCYTVVCDVHFSLSLSLSSSSSSSSSFSLLRIRVTVESNTRRRIFIVFVSLLWDRGGTVVKVLCYKSEGRWFDPSWCKWIFHWHQILPIALWPWSRLRL